MFPTPGNRKTFVVTCKRCRRDIPSGVRKFPFQSITVDCPSAANCAGTCPRKFSSVGLTNLWFTSSEPEAYSARPGDNV